MPAHFSMQATHTIDRPASMDCQIGHVESFRRVVGVLPAQGQQFMECNSELLNSVVPEVLLDEVRVEAVKAGCNCRMGGEEVSRSRDSQCHLKGLPSLFHEAQ